MAELAMSIVSFVIVGWAVLSVLTLMGYVFIIMKTLWEEWRDMS